MFKDSPEGQTQYEPAALAGVEPVELARLFHNAYERLAPSFGYETRPDTKAFDPQSPNGKLMTEVCRNVLAATVERLVQERDEALQNEAYESGIHASKVLELAEVREQLAASQAYAQQLREAYYALPKRIADFAFGSKDHTGTVAIGSAYLCVERVFSRDGIEPDKALSLPQDDTALRQWGAKLLRGMADQVVLGFGEYLRRKADELSKP
jgi:hypothetical protein